MANHDGVSPVSPLVILEKRARVQRVELGFDLDLWDALVERASANKTSVQDLINVGLPAYLEATKP